MVRFRVSRYAALAFVGALLLGGTSCNGGGGYGIATSSVTVSPATATATQLTSATATRTVGPSATAKPAATLELSADPKTLACDGEQASFVTARVLDEAGQPVADGTPVHFDVQALGSADPINTVTASGVARTSVIARGAQVGVVVNVTSGLVAVAIRIDCL
jgi:hypothetical protein